MADARDSDNPFAPPRATVADAPVATAATQELATRGQRFLAMLVDLSPGFVIGIVAAVAMPWFVARDGNAGTGVAAIVAGGLVFVACMAWGIANVLLVHRYGQTLGKYALGIRVVRTDGSRISFPRIFFVRGLLASIPAAIPFIGNLYRLVDYLFIFGAEQRCIHDYIADSKVVTAASSMNATLDASRAWPAIRT